MPRLSEVRLDGTAGALALVIGVALALAISLLPIVYARKAGSARSVTATPVPVGMPRWRRLFVVVQLAVAIIVLSTAALLFRSADTLARVNPGFVAEGVSVFELMLPDSRYGTPARRVEFQRRLLDAVADMPGGRRLPAVVDYLPFGGGTSIVNLTIEHHVVADATAKPRAALRGGERHRISTSSRFRRLTAGHSSRATRAPRRASRSSTRRSSVRYLPGEAVIGRRIKRGEATSKMPWMTIVGVVGSVRGAGLSLDPQPEVFVPYVKGGSRVALSLIVKSPAPPRALAPSIVERIHRVDPALSPSTITDMTELVGAGVRPAVLLRAAVRRARRRRVRAEPGRRLRRRGRSACRRGPTRSRFAAALARNRATSCA